MQPTLSIKTTNFFIPFLFLSPFLFLNHPFALKKQQFDTIANSNKGFPSWVLLNISTVNAIKKRKRTIALEKVKDANLEIQNNKGTANMPSSHKKPPYALPILPLKPIGIKKLPNASCMASTIELYLVSTLLSSSTPTTPSLMKPVRIALILVFANLVSNKKIKPNNIAIEAIKMIQPFLDLILSIK